MKRFCALSFVFIVALFALAMFSSTGMNSPAYGQGMENMQWFAPPAEGEEREDFFAAASIPKYSLRPVRVLLITGGHGFQEEPFFAMFDAMEGIVIEKAEMPAARDLLKPGLQEKYDCVVTYGMCPGQPSEEQAEDFIALLEEGIGFVSLHHNIGAHRDWDEYPQIIGGKFMFEDGEYEGVEFEKTPWAHGQDIDVKVADTEHPITQDIEDFTIHDETYGKCYVKPGVHVLLTTDHSKNNHEVAWTLTYGESAVCYIMLGHDSAAYANPAYPQLVRNAIFWAAIEGEHEEFVTANPDE